MFSLEIKDFISLSKYVNIYQMNNYLSLFNAYSSDLDNQILIKYLSKCKAKLTEISWLIKDLDDNNKKQYQKSCDDIENILDSGIKDIKKFNKIIDYINNLYKTVYYKSNNQSSINYIMEDNDNIKLIDHIKEN